MQRDIASSGIALQSLEIIGVTLEFRFASKEPFFDKLRPVAQNRRCNIVEIIFGMILNAPPRRQEPN